VPFFYLPTCRTREVQGGRPWAASPGGTREAGKVGKRQWRVRGFDSPPWLVLGWSEEAAAMVVVAALWAVGGALVVAAGVVGARVTPRALL